MQLPLKLRTFFTFIILVTQRPVASWFYNCYSESSILLQQGCNFKNLVITKDTNVDDIYFPPTNITFFVSNFSSFSPALGRRMAEETDAINFLNCSMLTFAIPQAVKKIGIYLSNVEKVFANYVLVNKLEHLSIMHTRITDIRFVEVLTALRTLFVVNNPIRYVNFERFRNLVQLEKIDLTANKITNIDSGLKPLVLPNLTELYLSDNYLIELDCRLWLFPSLQVMRLHTNFLKSLNVKELLRATPSLSEITLSKNFWNCRRLNLIVPHFKSRNVYLDDIAKLGCGSFDHFEYLSFTEQDNISETEQTMSVLNSTASESYQNSKSEKFKTLLERNIVLEEELADVEKRIDKLYVKYAVLKSWIRTERYT